MYTYIHDGDIKLIIFLNYNFPFLSLFYSLYSGIYIYSVILMVDNYYTTALRNGTVPIYYMNCGLMTMMATTTMTMTTRMRNTSQRKRRGYVVIIKRGSVFFPSSTSSLLELVFALFSIHPVDYKYLYELRRRKTTRVMSYVSYRLLPSSPSHYHYLRCRRLRRFLVIFFLRIQI